MVERWAVSPSASAQAEDTRVARDRRPTQQAVEPRAVRPIMPQPPAAQGQRDGRISFLFRQPSTSDSSVLPRVTAPAASAPSVPPSSQKHHSTPEKKMTSPDQERWLRVKEKLRAEVGEDIFQSWFARMDLERIEVNTAHLSVPTRFLKSWIQSHYTERVLACWQAENTDIQKIEVTVRCAMIRTAPPKVKPPAVARAASRSRRIGRLDIGELRAAYAPVSTGHDALGGSPLDLRLTFETFVVGRSNTLAHAAAKQVALARRGEPVMFNPLYIHAGVGPRQDPSAAGDHLGRQQRRRAQGALSHRRKVHVRLRLGAAHADGARLQGGAARHRRAGDRRPAVPARQVDAGRVLPHAQRADRRRPPGGDRRRPAADRSRKPRRPRALAARRRARGRDGIARRRAAARNPQDPRHGGAAVSSGLRRSGAGAGLYRQDPSPTTAAISKARSTACSRTTSSPASR